MSLIFCDNTVLCNFASVERVDLLESILRGRGRWTEAVAYEAERSRGHLPDLRRLIDDGWMGDPIAAARTDEEAIAIERMRRSVFGGSPDRPTQHLGESETLFVIRNHLEYAGAWWISDDREAVDYGRAQGLITKETLDLMRDAVAMADLDAHNAYELMLQMDDADRRLRVPSSVRELTG